MAKEILLTPKELDYSQRATKIAEDRKKNPNISLGILVEQLAEKTPGNHAVLYEDIDWTWQALNRVSNKVADYFLKIGCIQGDVIAIMMENSPEILSIPIGINKIQGIYSFINIHQRKKSLSLVFQISGPKWIIIDGDCLPSFNEVFNELGYEKNSVFVINNPRHIDHVFVDLEKELEHMSEENPSTTFNSYLSDVCMYIFTSGTTGLPKAATQSNARLINPFGSMALNLTQKDVVYCPLPLYHSHATVNGWASCVQTGCTFAFRKRFSASEFWKDIRKFNATCFLYIGEIPRYLLNRSESEYIESKSLKKMLGLGLREDIWNNFKTRFNIQNILEFYGATDGAGGLFNIEEKPGMIGRITVPKAIAVVKTDQDTGEFYKDEKGFPIHCKPGETGMMLAIIAENSNFMGYKDKNETKKKIMRNVFQENDTYFVTGDLVNLHEDNWVSFADRVGDTFRWKGENVATLEVETVLNSLPEIEICNVYGVEIPKHEGRAGMASIKLKKNHEFNPKKFADFIIENLPKYSIPLFVRIQYELEFTGTHKLRKINLRKQAYDINYIKDTVYLWSSSAQSYKTLDKDDYTNLLSGKLKI